MNERIRIPIFGLVLLLVVAGVLILRSRNAEPVTPTRTPSPAATPSATLDDGAPHQGAPVRPQAQQHRDPVVGNPELDQLPSSTAEGALRGSIRDMSGNLLAEVPISLVGFQDAPSKVLSDEEGLFALSPIEPDSWWRVVSASPHWEVTSSNLLNVHDSGDWELSVWMAPPGDLIVHAMDYMEAPLDTFAILAFPVSPDRAWIPGSPRTALGHAGVCSIRLAPGEYQLIIVPPGRLPERVLPVVNRDDGDSSEHSPALHVISVAGSSQTVVEYTLLRATHWRSLVVKNLNGAPIAGALVCPAIDRGQVEACGELMARTDSSGETSWGYASGTQWADPLASTFFVSHPDLGSSVVYAASGKEDLECVLPEPKPGLVRICKGALTRTSASACAIRLSGMRLPVEASRRLPLGQEAPIPVGFFLFATPGGDSAALEEIVFARPGQVVEIGCPGARHLTVHSPDSIPGLGPEFQVPVHLESRGPSLKRIAAWLPPGQLVDFELSVDDREWDAIAGGPIDGHAGFIPQRHRGLTQELPSDWLVSPGGGGVLVRCYDPWGERAGGVRVELLDLQSQESVQVVADQRGEAQFFGLRNDVLVRLPDSPSCSTSSIVQSFPWPTSDVISLVELQLCSMEAYIQGTVVTEKGTPVPPTIVVLQPLRGKDQEASPLPMQTLSSSSGTFNMGPIAPGTYRCELSQLGGEPVTLDIPPGPQVVQVTLFVPSGESSPKTPNEEVYK